MKSNQLWSSLKLLVLVVIGLCIFSTASFAQSCSFNGSWNSNYGKIKLTQNGNRISGTYGSYGNISGTVKGYILDALWWKGNHYVPGEDGGQVHFYISPDCNKLHGDWRDGDNSLGLEWHKGGWQATRIGNAQPTKPNYVQRSGGYGLPTYNNNSGGYNNKAAYNILCNWDGSWSTKWGTVTLWQTGPSTVEGSYSHKNGRLKGTISGNKYKGYWSQSPSYAPLNDAGEFVFTISPSCNSFTGSWRYGYSNHNRSWNHDWSGSKSR